MNNFQIHDAATELAAGRTAYSLAREVLGLRAQVAELRTQAIDAEILRRAYCRCCEEISELKAALVEEGEPVPIGPAVTLVHRLKRERAKLRAKVAESEAHLRRYMTYAEHLDAKPEIYDAAIAKRTAYEIRDRMARKLDRELDEAALELIEDIATEHAMAERAARERKRAKPADGYQPQAEAKAPANPPAAR